MLAAAGGPSIHPHAVSTLEDRARWDSDLLNFDADLRKLERFLTNVLAGRLQGQEIIDAGFAFFGIQGPWYTVGWQMAVLIEKTFGRESLIDCLCDPRKLLGTYNEAARRHNANATQPLALWSEELISAVS